MTGRNSFIGALALAALLPGCADGQQPARPPEMLPGQEQRADAAQRLVADSRRSAIVAAAERVAPAVVSVNVLRRERVLPRSIWEGFFLPPGAEREVTGFGSGFVVDAAGLVLTNEHVVRGADRVQVTLPDGREFVAEVVGTDEVTDLALLRISLPRGAQPLPVAPLGDSHDLLIGEWVIALGNPLGNLLANTEPTVTVGVVSGTGRNISPAGSGERGFYLDMIQTDASINPGNSGGPLVNALGEVVGVNSSILTRGGGSEGLGFAIPISRARRIAAELAAEGRVRRAWVGAELETMDGPDGRQVRVARVVPGSPAAAAGLRAGDVVQSAGGRRVRSPLDWDARLLDTPVGEPIDVVLGTAGRERRVRLVTGDLPSMTAQRIRALEDFELVTLTPAIRAERALASEHGALIVQLSEPAQRQLGLQPGDLIVQINRQPIRSAQEAAQLLRDAAPRVPIRLFFERGGRLGSTSFYVN
jgi:serine protease Do